MGLDSIGGLQFPGSPSDAQLRDAYSRIRWNAQVLGVLAHRMDEHPADPAIGVAPPNSGTHLRWRFDPLRGWPNDGFYIYRRPPRGHWVKPFREVDFPELPSATSSAQLFVPFFESGRLRLTDGAGLRIRTGEGLHVADASLALHVHFPVSVHEVAIAFGRANGPVTLQGYHGAELVFHASVPAGTLEPAPCYEMVDSLRVSAPRALVTSLRAIPVFRDVQGWEPLGRVPPLGAAPYDAGTIVSRLDADEGLSVDERKSQVTGIIDSIRGGATAGPASWAESAAPGASSIQIEAPVLVDLMSLQPRVARAFGLYAVDPAPLDEPADYMVVGAWCPRSGNRAAGIALFEDSEAPPAPGGVALTDLARRLIGAPGLLYLAPVFRVSRERALLPVAPAPPTLVIDGEARRQLDATGNALIELLLRVEWDLAAPVPPNPPALARQIPSLATVEFTVGETVLGEDLGPPHVDELGTRDASEIVSIPVANLPTVAVVRVRSADVFGQKADSAVSAPVALPASLYPTAPPPAAFTGELARVGVGVELRSSWVWGGRSALFHPGAQGFDLEWLEDLDLPAVPVREALDASTAWRTLARVAPLEARNVGIVSLDDVLTLATQTAQLVHAQQKGAVLGPLFAGMRTSLSLGHPASGRLNGWGIRLAGRNYVITHHTIGDNVSFFFTLPGDSAAGTPFDGIEVDGDSVELIGIVELRPIAGDTSTAVVTVSSTAEALAAVGAGALVTQVIDVFPVLGRTTAPSEQAVVQTAFRPQEPGSVDPVRILPAVGAAKAAAVQTDARAIGATAPTRDHPVRRVFVRARTVDSLGRRGLPSTPFETQWSAVFPPIPAAGPVVDRGSPSDAFGQCRLLVSFNLSLAQCGVYLHRATDEQLRTVWTRWRDRARDPNPAQRWTLFGLPGGFVWPDGIVAPVDVKDPLTDFVALPDSMRVFINTLRARSPADPAGAPGVRVFDEAFDRRGRMWRAADASTFTATADGERLEFLDVGERVGNKYFYRATLVDPADREGAPSGVSLPGQGLNIAAPPAPMLLAPLVMPTELVIRWEGSTDPRITRYRITRHPTWDGAPADTVLNPVVADVAAPLRVHGARVSLPNFPASGVTLTQLDTPDGASLLTLGRTLSKEASFLFWYADGNRAAIEVSANDGSSIRPIVPVAGSGGIPEGTTVYPSALRLLNGVVDTGQWPGLAQAGTTLALADGSSAAVTTLGAWRDAPFLTAMRLEELTAVVLELTSTQKVDNAFARRAVGRCPAAPTAAAITMSSGVIDLSGLLNEGERVTGVYLASAVTLPTPTGAPDPERSKAKTLISQIRMYQAGFARRLRENVPMVFMFTPLAEATPRYVGHDRAIAFSGGRASVPPWNESLETLVGVFERSALSIVDGTVSATDAASNLVYGTVSQSRLGRVQLLVPDGSEVVARSADGAEVHGRLTPLVWRSGALACEGLLDGAVFAAAHLYDASQAADGTVADTTRDRLSAVTLNADRNAFTVNDPIAEGLRVIARYRRVIEDPPGFIDEDVRQDPRRRELSYAISENDIGRKWAFGVQAICDFGDPVGEVLSAPSTVEVEVSPPAGAGVSVTSVAWLESGELEVTYTGGAGMRYRVEAQSSITGKLYVLADEVAVARVATLMDTNGKQIPVTESLSIRVTGRYPNASDRVFRPASVAVAARDAEPVIDLAEV